MDSNTSAPDWQKLMAPFDAREIKWRQDGKPFRREDGFAVRCVPYLSAAAVRERLDTVVVGAWSYAVHALPTAVDGDGGKILYGVKGSLTICGVTRDDVGQGKDYKVASTDAFKRAAQRFGIGRELSTMPRVIVRAEVDGKYAKLLERPEDVFQQRTRGKQQSSKQSQTTKTDLPECPKCGHLMHDNTRDQRPNYRCKDKECGHRIYLNEDGQLPLGDPKTTGRTNALRDG